MRDPPQDPEPEDHGRNREQVEGQVGREGRAGDALQPILAAGDGRPLEGDLEGDLRAGERQEREVEAFPAQDQRPDDERESRRDHNGKDKREDVVGVAVEDRQRRYVTGAAEEHRGAERDEAGVAEQEVHAGAVERVDRDLGDQADRSADRLPEQGQGAEDEGDPESRVEEKGLHSNLSHRSPNRPRGRTSRITAIRMYMAAPDHSGWNWIVRAVVRPTSGPAMMAPE